MACQPQNPWCHGNQTVPCIPWSHPFIERLIGTIRRECLDPLLFWTATDLETKTNCVQDYYNRHRIHAGLKGETPIETMESKGANLKSYRWQPHCRGLYQTPIASRGLIRHGQELLLVAAKYAP